MSYNIQLRLTFISGICNNFYNYFMRETYNCLIFSGNRFIFHAIMIRTVCFLHICFTILYNYLIMSKFSLYIYTYPSILDCPDIPYDYLMPLFAQFYRLLPSNPQVPLVYQHKTNRSLGPYCHQENDIFDETTNLHKIDIRSSSYIQSVASSLPTELVELIGVNHFQHMIVFCT